MNLQEIKTIGIGGSGVMGSSMAQILAKFNYDVIVFDIADEAIEKSRNLIEVNQQTLVEQKELSQKRSDAIKNKIKFSSDMKSLAGVDFIVEAIVEKMDIKQDFWKKLSEVMREDIVVASNTSGLSLTEIAKAVKKPERFAGMHWINPPHLIPLVEVICAEFTSDEAAKTVYDLAVAVGKLPVIVKKDAPGFVFNRIQFALLREALYIVDSGIADVADVDKVLTSGMGMRYSAIGPFQIADFGGLDTFYNIASYLFEDLSDAKQPSALLSDLYKNNNFGVKSGKGFYDYSGGKDKEAIRHRDTLLYKLSKCLWP